MSQPHYVLELRYADGTAETHEIYDERRILGRSKVKADLHVSDKKASGKHAELVFQDGHLAVRDLGSTNGTFFHGTRMEGSFQLKPGEACKVGDAQVRLLAINGLPEDEDARTVVGAPAFVYEEPEPPADRTRALDAAELAGIVGASGAGQPLQAKPAPSAAPEQPASGGLELRAKPPADAHRPPPAEPPAQPPVGASPAYPAPSYGGGSSVTVQLQTTGGDLFKAMIGHYLLCLVTAFLYLPWAVVAYQKFLYSRLVISGTPRGRVHLQWHGSGGQLFKVGLVGYLLTVVTLGIYGAWFMVKLGRYFVENTTASSDDGTQYHFQFSLHGKDLFIFLLVNYLLVMVTLGLYTPWFICKMQRLMTEHFQVLSQGQRVGGFEFHGEGGSLLGTFIVGYLLTLVTFGIYGFWFQVSLLRWMAEHTYAAFGHRRWQAGFAGTGLELLKISIVAMFLIPLTLGVWIFWYLADLLKFQFNNTRFDEVGA